MARQCATSIVPTGATSCGTSTPSTSEHAIPGGLAMSNPFDPTTELVLNEAFGWLHDCGVVDPDDCEGITSAQVIALTSNLFEGGWSAFLDSISCLEEWAEV